MGRARSPIKSVWSLAAANGSLYAGVSRPGCSAATTAARPGAISPACASIPRGPTGSRAARGLILHSLVPHPETTTSSGSASRRPACSTPPTAARPGSRATAAPAPTSCRRTSAIPNSASACTAWSWRRACPTGSTSRTIAACTAATTAAGSWHSIEAGLPSSFGFPAAAHPRDPDTLYLLPLNGDIAGRYVPDGKAAVWRTRDGGADLAGPAQGPAAGKRLFRRAAPGDGDRPAGPGRRLFRHQRRRALRQRRRGRQLAPIAQHLPGILSVETLVLDG